MFRCVIWWKFNWDSNDSIKVRCWTFSFLRHSWVGAHSNLLKHFNESLSGLDLSKMLQMSINGPAVNWKFFDALMNYRSECESPQLIIIGSCFLYAVHRALKTAFESTSWKIKQTLKANHFSSVQLVGLKINQWQTMLLKSGQAFVSW